MLIDFIKELTGLPESEVGMPEKRSEGWVFPLRPAAVLDCLNCGHPTHRKRAFTRLLRHTWTPSLGLLYVEAPCERRRCPRCGLTCTLRPACVPERGSATETFRRLAVSRYHERTIQSVSRELKLPYTTLESWFYEETAAEPASRSVRRVGVDDFALRKGHTYGVTVVDLDTRQVLGACEGRKETDIRELLERTAKDAQIVVSDAAPAMAKAVANACPKARHVLDRFHLIQLFTDSMKRRRKVTEKGRGKHGETRHLLRLLTGKPEQRTSEEAQELGERLSTDEGLKARYEALQHFRYVLKSSSFVVAKKRLDGFLKRFSFHQTAAVSQIAKAISSRKEGVRAAAVQAESNGRVEGINTKIKLLKRRAYGYRNMTHFLQRIQLETGLQAVRYR